MHIRFGPQLAATLLTLCIGVQVLEMTGRWDRTLQDTADEAVIVTVALCIGSVLVVARTTRERLCLSLFRSWIVLIRTKRNLPLVASQACPAFIARAPSSLRI